MEVVYFASLRLFHHSCIQQSRLVGKSSLPPPSWFALRCPCLGEWSKSPKEASPTGFKANSGGLTGVPQRGQKLVGACERALAPPLRPFYRASSLRAFRGGSARRDREDISPESGFLRLLFFFFFNRRTFRSCELYSSVSSATLAFDQNFSN